MPLEKAEIMLIKNAIKSMALPIKEKRGCKNFGNFLSNPLQ